MKLFQTKKPDAKKMNTLFFIIELYLSVVSLITVYQGFNEIAIYLLSMTVFVILIHCILYRRNYNVNKESKVDEL